jgi:HEAT repeat protein
MYALGKTGNPKGIAPIVKILKISRDSDERETAARALGRFKHHLTVEPLINALDDKDMGVREKAIDSLSKSYDMRALNVFIEMLSADNPILRALAASKLRDFKHPLAVNALINTLNDDNLNVRRSVIFALGKIGDSRAVEPLTTILNETTDKRVKHDVIVSLNQINNPYTFKPFLREPLDPGPDSIPILISKLDNSNEEVVDRANLSLMSITGYFPRNGVDWNEWWNSNKGDIVKYKSEDMVASFIVALDDPSPTVKIFAIGFLGRMKDTRAVEPLIKQYNSDNYDKYTRRAIIQALAKLKTPRSTETLIASLNKDKGYSNYIAVRALGDFNDPIAVEPLIRSLENSDEVMDVEYLLSALRKLGDPRATDAIIEKLKSPDPRIRGDAARALEGAGNMSAIPHLKKALDDEDRYVREYVARAILVIDGRYFDEEQYGEDQREKQKGTIWDFIKSIFSKK